MPKANLYNMAGEVVGEVELSEAVFGIEPNTVVLHSVIKNTVKNIKVKQAGASISTNPQKASARTNPQKASARNR